MKIIFSAALIAPFFFAGDPDTLITRKTHTDAFTMRNNEVPAQDATQTIWIHGKDKLRMETGDRITIVRLDEKKMYILNAKDKTASIVDLPFDMTKYMPEEIAARMADRPKPTVTVTPTEETKKIKDWNTKKYTVARSGGGGFGGGGGGGTSTETVWASTDVRVDATAFREMMGQLQSMQMGAGGPDDMKKVEGFPVLIERSRTVGEDEVKSSDALVSIEQKEAPAGAYDVPADFEKKPFEFRMSGGPGGGAGGGRNGGGGGRGGRRGGDGAASRRADSQPASKPAKQTKD